MITPDLYLYLDAIGNFDVLLFAQGMFWLMASIIGCGIDGALLLMWYDWASEQDALDYYENLANGLEEYEALSVVDSLYNALAMQQSPTGPAMAFTLPPHIAALPSMEELMEVPEPSLPNQGEDVLSDEEFEQDLQEALEEEAKLKQEVQDALDKEEAEFDELWARLVPVLEKNEFERLPTFSEYMRA